MEERGEVTGEMLLDDEGGHVESEFKSPVQKEFRKSTTNPIALFRALPRLVQLVVVVVAVFVLLLISAVVTLASVLIAGSGGGGASPSPVEYVPVPAEESAHTNQHPRHYVPLLSEQRYHEEQVELWMRVFPAANAGYFPPSTAQGALDKLYWDDCLADDDFFRMFADPICTMLWIRKLQYEDVESIDDLLAVITEEEEEAGLAGEKPTQNGGFRCNMNDGTTVGYWKPCYGKGSGGTSESYKGEILSALFDRLAGFYRTCAVGAYYFPKAKMMSLAADLAKISGQDEVQKMETVMHHCDDGVGRGAEGAMVGWAPFPVERFRSSVQKEGRLFDFRKMSSSDIEHLSKTVFDVDASSSDDELRLVLENVAVYLVNLIGGYPPKLDHNVYVMHPRDDYKKDGPFVYIDNDRTSWRHHTTMQSWKIKDNDAMCQLCKFPKSIVDRIYTFYQPAKKQAKEQLSYKLLELSNSIYPHLPNGALMVPANITILDGNMEWIMKCIDNCVAHHGIDNTIIAEPWVHEYNFFDYYKALEESRVPISKRSTEKGEPLVLASELLRPRAHSPANL
eukprot:TRINITY_DN2355_c0_g1_i1.p1 TRINITY_DN2355_c0_g1~~TRINITY_DN2355_c0_g1_i1.p1  ORF type:complete len:576 (-),score=172.77 TRINITY_DN2355_c0_g1_i1:285-1979(-)